MSALAIDEDRIRTALAGIVDPSSGSRLADMGIVSDVAVRDSNVQVVLEVAPAQTGDAAGLHALRAAVEAAISALPGVTSASVVMTAHAAATAQTPPAPEPHAPEPPAPLPGHGPAPLPGVNRVIAISSGKGGVGKSTVTANLAVALAAAGHRVGVIDADVYGPSQPRMLGIAGRPSTPDGSIILPLRNHGVSLMSLGLLVGEDEAIAWRGPMLMGALQQMLAQVQWGRLDVLLVDLPPGTGDVQMTLCQKTVVAGAVVVSTPQDIALIDARKGIDMFQRMNIPILGIVENMASFVCSDCGKLHYPFGHGGAKAEAEKLGVPFLGEVPLDLDIRVTSDAGTPIVAAKPDSQQAAAFRQIADRLGVGASAS